MIFHEPKICFIHPPRTGGTSVEHALMKKYPQAVQLFVSHHFQGYDRPVVKIKSIHTKKLPNQILEYHKKHATYDECIEHYPDFKYYATVRHPEKRLESLYKLLTWSETDGVPWVNIEFNHWIDQVCIGDYAMAPQDVLDSRMFTMTQSDFIGDSEWHRVEDGSIFHALDIDFRQDYELNNNDPMDWTPRSLELVRIKYREDYERFNYDMGL